MVSMFVHPFFLARRERSTQKGLEDFNLKCLDQSWILSLNYPPAN